MMMNEEKKVFSVFFQHTIVTFAYSIIAMTITGQILANYRDTHNVLSILGHEGLTYQSIMQIFALSAVLGVLITLLTSDIILKHVMLLWRYATLLFLSTVACGLFVVIFRWFPLDLWQAWVGFILFFVTFFIIGLSAMIAKTKIEDKRYEKLLSIYKSKKGEC